MPLLAGPSGASVVPTWINGKAVALDVSSLFEVRNAVTGVVPYLAQGASVASAISAADASWTAFNSWKRATVTRRREILLRVADIFERRIDDLTTYQVEETACQNGFGRFNVKYAQQILRETAAGISSIRGEIPPMESKDTWAMVFKEPCGPVLAIPPWNSAVILGVRAVCTPIAAGCTVVMKASELCPRTHFAILEAFEEAGLPAGVLNQVQVSRSNAADVTEALVAARAIRKIEFIGSGNVGRIVGKMAAQHLKPIIMELGGKSPAIVLDDADIEKAATLCAIGAFLHHGQICFSTERIIVMQSILDAFQKALVKIVNAEHRGAGNAVDQRGADHANDLLIDAQSHGAKFLTGGPGFEGPATLKPTIITQVAKEARIFDVESFGPSASLYSVETQDEALEVANSSAYGLTASIHTTNLERAIKLARELDFGIIHINSITEFEEATGPVSGRKGSGWGRSNGHWGLNEFLDDKMVSVHGSESGVTFG